MPGLDRKVVPLQLATGPQSEAMSAVEGGPQSEAISRLTIWGGEGGCLVNEDSHGNVPWSTPTLTEVTDADEVQVIRLAIAELEKAA